MSWLSRKHDPIDIRERALRARIGELDSQIRQLRGRLAAEQTQPRLRSTAVAGAGGQSTPIPAQGEPSFEQVNHNNVQQPDGREDAPALYNELGLRKYDPLAGIRRWLGQFRSPPTASPKLVNYLAAGSIHGLRPLRYEKRVARNWFLGVCVFFILMLWGLVYFYFRNR